MFRKLLRTPSLHGTKPSGAGLKELAALKGLKPRS